MPQATLDPAHPQTRQRLLDAAGEVFAERGFRNATVRDICQRARANIAAVNYHFGGKEELYAAVFRDAHLCAVERFPADLGLPPGASAEQRLGAYIRAFLRRILDVGRPAWHGKLMSREMIEPTAALDMIVEEAIRPQFAVLRAIVQELLGKGTPENEVRYWGASVIAQCLFYNTHRPVITRMYPDLTYDGDMIDTLAEHITRFSLTGLRGSRCPRKAARAKRRAASGEKD